MNRKIINCFVVFILFLLLMGIIEYNIGYQNGNIDGFSTGVTQEADYMTHVTYANAQIATVYDLENHTQIPIYNSDFYENNTMKADAVRRIHGI
jgi:exopolysaccharide biosynthesis protein